jgi:uncharacterized membrane protein YkoI
MIHARVLVVALALAGAAPDMAAAADRKACLNPDQRRAAIAAHKAVPLTRAVRTVKARIHGEVVHARLCEREKGLVYVLTVLARDGKVTQAMVDATDGRWLDGS